MLRLKQVCCTRWLAGCQACSALVWLLSSLMPALHVQLMECQAEDDYVCSVAWAADGKHVSVGTSSAQVQVHPCCNQLSRLCHRALSLVACSAGQPLLSCLPSSRLGASAQALLPVKYCSQHVCKEGKG